MTKKMGSTGFGKSLEGSDQSGRPKKDSVIWTLNRNSHRASDFDISDFDVSTSIRLTDQSRLEDCRSISHEWHKLVSAHFNSRHLNE